MIRVKFYRKEGRFFGFQLKGHAEYAEPGEDILCSAVSALAINTVNSLEELTRDRIIAEVPGVNRVLWDYSDKPVSTIEWE